MSSYSVLAAWVPLRASSWHDAVGVCSDLNNSRWYTRSGSSHGHTRIIRTAYAEHPCYVPLVRRAFAKWYELEQLTGRHLLTECTCLNAGPPQSEHVAGVRSSVREHSLVSEELSANEITRRFPVFRFPADYSGILEQAAGFLYVEDCVRAN